MNIINKIKSLTGIKRALLKFLGLTLLLSLILRFAIPYCQLALKVKHDSIGFFFIGLLTVTLLFLIIMAIVKKKFYVEFVAVMVSAIVVNGMTADILTKEVQFKLGTDLYCIEDMGTKLYNKWGIECVDFTYRGFDCIVLVKNEKNQELVLTFNKIGLSNKIGLRNFKEQPENSEFEVRSYNLDTNEMLNFIFNEYVRDELKSRNFTLIDYKYLSRNYFRDELNEYRNPFSDFYKNFRKTNETVLNTNSFYEEEDEDEEKENYSSEEDDEYNEDDSNELESNNVLTPVVSFTLTPPSNYGDYWNEKKVDDTRYTVSIRPTISDNNEYALYICVDQKPSSTSTENNNIVPQGMDPTGGMFSGIIDMINTQNAFHYSDDYVKILCTRADGRTFEYKYTFPAQKQTNYPQNPYKHFFINSSTGCRVEYADTYEVYFNGLLVATYKIPSKEYFSRFEFAAKNNVNLGVVYLMQSVEQYNQIIQTQMNDYNSVRNDIPSTGGSGITAPQVEKYCHLCKGRGACNTCGGDGLFQASFGLDELLDCPNCSAPHHRCSSCGGTGRK